MRPTTIFVVSAPSLLEEPPSRSGNQTCAFVVDIVQVQWRSALPTPITRHPSTATGAPSGTREGRPSAVVVSIMTPIIVITVVVIYYDGYPILLHDSFLGGATCQWGIVYDLLWVL